MIVSTLKTIAIIIGIMGGFYGIVEDMNFGIIGISVISALLMYGFSEIIELLQDINNKIERSTYER